ncbi:MAG TPA: hypothetical protein VF493_17370, partial [Terriglobales bacterium]
MHKLRVLLVEIALVVICVASAYSQNRADWMAQARWGVMTHYLADWKSRDYNIDMNVDEWNKLIDKFDVEKLADQLQSAGVSYYQISIGQNSGYYLSPNATYDKIVGTKPSKLSRRDLVADLYEALNKRGIK